MYRRGDGKHSDYWMAGCGQWKLRKVQSRCFSQVGNGLLYRFALRRGACLRIEGYESAFFGVCEDSG
ncbi:MAG: hypothetical protein A2W28_08595 [Gammaproteobacteria bacterium RBG_16_51_14]|nr:MAG: hypothetical protein A2W28_08595 [Gammaproteobacteria bacterium RBG_16_51_14]